MAMSDLKLSRSNERRLVDALVHSLKAHPKAWSSNQHTVTNTQTGAEIWTANGRFALSLYNPVKTTWFRFWNRRRLWNALRPFTRTKERRELAKIDDLIAALVEASP